MAIEIVDLPIKNSDFPKLIMLVYQRVTMSIGFDIFVSGLQRNWQLYLLATAKNHEGLTKTQSSPRCSNLGIPTIERGGQLLP